ncbi:MAG: transcription-repair coupling factor [Verrucomicrobiaceae bacterium]|nr:transcription-repair coupling factor [Verrucomicrobiaceae bacterium]
MVLHAAQEKNPAQRVWIICPDARTQEHVHAELAVWHEQALFFPRLSSSGSDALPDPETSAERISALTRLRESRDRAIITIAADSLNEAVPALKDIETNRFDLQAGARTDVEVLIAKLSAAGYERVPVVGERGQFARRGGILDFFSWNGEEPLRVEFFDNEIESIRAFDIHTQASVRRMDKVSVVLQIDDAKAAASKVRDHLSPRDLVIAVECGPDVPVDVTITSGSTAEDDVEDFSTAIHDNPLGVFDASDFVLHEARRRQFDAQVAEWHALGWRTLVFFHNDAERERFAELVGQDKINEFSIEPQLGLLFRGFTIPAAKTAVLTGAEIFGRHQHTRRIRGSKLDEAQALRHARDLLRDLKEGDCVVHAEYGIGRFEGIEVREVDKKEEVLVLQYAEGGKLFVPLSHAHMISRYVGVGGKRPALNKIGDGRWAKTRKSAERSVEEFAARMLSIQAERTTLKATAHPPDTKWQREFEDSFVYRETPDQLRSVEEIKRDMESGRPMDRLLCADVGFGKTEVAIRAAFKAVMGGRQVAVLVPTTVLAAQHWQTFRERMSEFPVSVEMLCRLTPANKEREIVKSIADGSVDIVIGTHRLISKDVHFKNLGLVVVDEEQRFGVKHKERFKELFRLIDVLTLSATPIPRTLYLALMGMRDMSTIETPPPNRSPVQTSISPYDERIIRSSIDAELDRGGQIFFLHNRVMTIERMADKIRALCPRARVIVGHGQMEGEMLEEVMHRFVDGEADVLVCTTIIESGVDIPNANTIIIDRADRFGLADLYQLRGRVGRSGTRAHAFLMLPRDAVTAGDARKRVNAIKQYTELGSGFKIAMRDLEIRGAGNLLGTAQSGHIAAVGFDLYCQMLKVAVNKAQGRRTARPVEVSLRADFLCVSESLFAGALPGTTPAFIPMSYVEDAKLRIQAYRMLGEVMTRRELDDLEAQWTDQFGPLPHAVENLLTCAAIRLAATHAGISDVEIKDRKLILLRNGQFMQVGGRFPRLTAKEGFLLLREALQLLRTF